MKTAKDKLDAGANGFGETGLQVPAGGTPSVVMREVHGFLADIEDLVKATTSLTGEDLARAKAKITERVAAARKSVEDASAAIAQGARRGVTATNGYVHENPWQAVGIGAAGGLLLGLLLARRT